MKDISVHLLNYTKDTLEDKLKESFNKDANKVGRKDRKGLMLNAELLYKVKKKEKWRKIVLIAKQLKNCWSDMKIKTKVVVNDGKDMVYKYVFVPGRKSNIYILLFPYVCVRISTNGGTVPLLIPEVSLIYIELKEL